MELIDHHDLSSVRGGFGAILGALLQAAPGILQGVSGIIGASKSGGSAPAQAAAQQPSAAQPPAAAPPGPPAAGSAPGGGTCAGCCGMLALIPQGATLVRLA